MTTNAKQLGTAASKTNADEELLRSMTIETGSAFEAAHSRVVERANTILKTIGRGEKLDKLSRLHQAIVRVARSYGADRTVAFQIACEEIAMHDKMKGGTDQATGSGLRATDEKGGAA